MSAVCQIGVKAHGFHQTGSSPTGPPNGAGRASTPNGIRTRVAAVKGRCPRPLDDGGRWPAGRRESGRTAAERRGVSLPGADRAGRRRWASDPSGSCRVPPRPGRMEGAGQKALDGADHQDGDPKQVDFDQKGGEVGEVLGVPHGGLGHHHRQEHPPGPSHPLGHIAPCGGRPRGQRSGPPGAGPGWRGARPGPASAIGMRLATSWPRGLAGMRTGPGRRRPGGNDEAQDDQDAVVEPQQRTGERAGRAEPGPVVARWSGGPGRRR